MKKIKILIAVLFISFLSGCTVNYNIVINEDLSIEENASIEETQSYFEENYTYYNSSEIVDSLWNLYIEDYKEANYTYTQNSKQTGVYAKAQYKNFEEYKSKTTIYHQLFENVDYNVEGNIVTLRAIGYYPYNDQDPNRFAIDKATITIRIPFKVIETNADKISSDTYVWNVDKYDNEKEIIVKFDLSKVLNKKENKDIYYFIVFGIIVTIIGIVLFVTYKIKNNDNSI